MHRFRLLGLALIAVFALGAIASSAALANPEILPDPGETKVPLKFTSTGGKSELVSMEHPEKFIECDNVTNTGEFTSAEAGKVTIDFTKCKTGALKCWSLGDEASGAKKETILVNNAAIQLVDILPGGILTPGAVVKLTSALHIECQGSLLILITEAAIGELEKVTKEPLLNGVKVLEVLLLYKLDVTHLQLFKECDLSEAFCLEKKVPKKFELLTNFGAGPEPSGEITDDTIKFEKEAAIDF